MRSTVSLPVSPCARLAVASSSALETPVARASQYFESRYNELRSLLSPIQLQSTQGRHVIERRMEPLFVSTRSLVLSTELKSVLAARGAISALQRDAVATRVGPSDESTGALGSDGCLAGTSEVHVDDECTSGDALGLGEDASRSDKAARYGLQHGADARGSREYIGVVVEPHVEDCANKDSALACSSSEESRGDEHAPEAIQSPRRSSKSGEPPVPPRPPLSPCLPSVTNSSSLAGRLSTPVVLQCNKSQCASLFTSPTSPTLSTAAPVPGMSFMRSSRQVPSTPVVLRPISQGPSLSSRAPLLSPPASSNGRRVSDVIDPHSPSCAWGWGSRGASGDFSSRIR